MAPIEPDGGKLDAYLAKDFQATIEKYDELWEVEDPEEQPYRSKYVAREMLEITVKQVEQLIEDEVNQDAADRGRELLARLFLFLGKNLYFCEEVPQAEKYFIRSLERYLRSPLRLSPEPFCFIQDVFNQLGMLWCNRGGHREGMNFLRRAQVMYVNRPQTVREVCEARCENNYTMTMFYLAQAYGALQKPALSARFCAETMSRQLESNSVGSRSREVKERDPFDCRDWIRNCCALSDFFVNECMFWTSEYLLHSALVLCERCVEICGAAPDNVDELKAECLRDLGIMYAVRLKFARTCVENPGLWEQVWRGERKVKSASNTACDEGTKLSFRVAADRKERPPEGGTGPILWDSMFPEVVHLEDEEAQDNRLAEESEAGEKAAGEEDRWLDLGPAERVRLPVHFRPLHGHIQRRMHRANAAFLEQRGELPSEPASGSDADGTSPHQPSCVGSKFEAAREIFKLGNHFMAHALNTYVLDGWVTEHVKILQELATMYKTLQFWEKDAKRAAAMLKRRAALLCPLLDQLNPKVYVAFWRQLSFSCAELYQELYELKANGKMPGSRSVKALTDDDEDEGDNITDVKKAARCNELAKNSVKYYGMFIDSYHPDGKPVDRVDTDHANAYLTAKLNRARVRTKMIGLGVDEEIEAHKLALREYEEILAYGNQNPEALGPEVNMATELALCKEMAAMLPSKLARLAAKRR
eukprot:TRINITY_DN79050_c0_g1_i1.p1 TRINITY_DN79050_c0_g1~~TRINITY_DN79050_c0_g1_i1.p1  ORF type:complete len:702 (+),score=166.97 TRINITY_DN79050_c0_g1_i1:48-2153(+)